MIYTITPNPALDLGGIVDELIPNEKAYVYDETRFPGGNALNASRIIQKLGYPVIAGGFLGGGTGEEIKSLLRIEKVPHHFIQIKNPTRVNVTVSHRKTFLQTRLSFPGPKVSNQEIKDLYDWISEIPLPAFLILGGSFPPGFSTQNVKQLIKIAHRRKIPVVIDVPGKALKDLVNSYPLLIKPNLLEFHELIGKRPRSIQTVLKEAKKLTAKVPWVCISSVEKGALLVTRNTAWFGKIPPLQIKTTVGAGDAMVGAMCAQLWKKMLSVSSTSNTRTLTNPEKHGEELLRWGLASAGATLMTPGTHLGEVQQIHRLFPKILIRQLS